ncbi:HU family DNA-binding protein [Halocynthiibacter sp. C4]|uniref:HU family DNA-binding protein n=1 Tax=Halocynthiibacter sp. C4 TaxID=2992758 RepID=UPI00237A15F0|nr:HU family DNA-binding protein [Halocynthiibacter sp. C4]MDE0589339.1 HU family DNA-binding protein [Halocynthiibacter sp. C4]
MTTKPRKTSKPAAPKATAPEVPVEKVSEDTAPTVVLKKKEFIERCVVKSELKKRDVKPSVEAALAVLGEALAAGEDLNLQPFGKLVVKKKNEQPNSDVYVCRVRQPKHKPA